MKSSATWSTASVLALSALGAVGLVVVGCTVTSGTVDDVDGGPTTSPDRDSGNDSGTDAAALVSACPGNIAQEAVIVSVACQACLDQNCCSQLGACFNHTPVADPDGGAATDDCNRYAACVSFCLQGAEADRQSCFGECNLASPTPIQTAYDDIITCGTANPTCKAACNFAE